MTALRSERSVRPWTELLLLGFNIQPAVAHTVAGRSRLASTHLRSPDIFRAAEHLPVQMQVIYFRSSPLNPGFQLVVTVAQR